jgi:hypothetical protein
MDDDGAGTDEASQPTKVNPRDGLIDFAPYSIEQLRELQYSIDSEAFPQNHRHLLAALRQREASTVPPPPTHDEKVYRYGIVTVP